MKKTQLFIFDLDDTVIDSSHRATLTVDNGQVVLDLDAWRKDSTYENIMKDSLLPLANYMRECIKQNIHMFGFVLLEICKQQTMIF